jgi:hypothetical protein
MIPRCVTYNRGRRNGLEMLYDVVTGILGDDKIPRGSLVA